MHNPIEPTRVLGGAIVIQELPLALSHGFQKPSINEEVRASSPAQISNAATKTPIIVNVTASFTVIAIIIPNHVAAPILPARNMSL